MKVAIVNTLYPPIVVGGAEKSVSLLAEAFLRRDHSISVISLHSEKEYVTDLRNGVVVHRLPLDNVYWPFERKKAASGRSRIEWHLRDIWNIRAAARVQHILEADRPDVLHTNNLSGFSVAVWRVARLLGIPVVHTLRDYSLLCRRATLFRKGKCCEKRCFDCRGMCVVSQRACDLVSEVVSNSRFVLDIHRTSGFFCNTSGHVVFNIMDIAAPILRAVPGQNSAVTFGFIGKIDTDKGIEVVLKATKKLTQKRWRLLIAGRGNEDYISKLRELYPDSRIEWLGFVSSERFFSEIDVTLVASVWPEPLPRTLIESIAYGRATICSTAGGIPEISDFSKLIGSYEASDVDKLAQLMDAAIRSDGLARSGSGSSEVILTEFSEDEVYSRYYEIYKRAVNSKK